MKVEDFPFDAEWRVNEKSKYYKTPYLYKENGFNDREKAEELINEVKINSPESLIITNVEKKKETKNPPLLFNLAELQNECSKLFKISPDETLRVTQELYEKKMVTYPRTDARVLSTAVAKEIYKNINGIKALDIFKEYCEEILSSGTYKNIAKTRYVNDKQITDHYAIIPTGQGFGALNSLNPISKKVYQVIVRRILSIFYPAAIYQKVSLICSSEFKEERIENFHASFKVLLEEGYLKVLNVNNSKQEQKVSRDEENNDEKDDAGDAETKLSLEVIEKLKKLKKNDILLLNGLGVKEGETAPPKRYNSGSIILAMENAGQLIEDEELRAQIKGSGIGTSATRAEILKKLVNIKYIKLNTKTQIITPSQMGEMIYDVVECSIKQLLNPELTASWEKGLTYVAEGSITPEEYMNKLETFVSNRVNGVKKLNNQYELNKYFERASAYYK